MEGVVVSLDLSDFVMLRLTLVDKLLLGVLCHLARHLVASHGLLTV